jgi:ABC-2 type transporter
LDTLIFTGLIYFSVDIGLSISVYLNICLVLVMSGICANAYGFFLSGLFESFSIGIDLAQIIDTTLLLFSGMYINVKFVTWYKYISFFYYANEGIAINYWSEVETIRCPDFLQNTCQKNGTLVLESMGFQTTYNDLYMNYFYQLILTIVLHLLAFWGIQRNLKKRGFY